MVSLNGSGINGILNTASGSKMKITSVPIEDIVRNEQNEYSIEGIDSLAASIHDVGLRQPIEVKRLPDGTYQLIGGERRLTAMKKLLEEGDTRWQMVPCVVSNPPELDLPISDELKELYALTTSSAAKQTTTRCWTSRPCAGFTQPLKMPDIPWPSISGPSLRQTSTCLKARCSVWNTLTDT